MPVVSSSGPRRPPQWLLLPPCTCGPGNFLRPAQLKGLHGALVLACKVSAASLTDGAADDLLAVSRFGVGYDSVDIKACTENDVAVLIAVGSVDRSMAEAAVGWMISMTHNMIQKHQLVVEGGSARATGIT